MYEAFDTFLKIPTCYTRHPSDENRFFLALREVVNDPRFDPDELGKYIDRRRDAGEVAQANLTEEAYEDARDWCVCAAQAVQKYLSTVE